jgi:hypothetical protein
MIKTTGREMIFKAEEITLKGVKPILKVTKGKLTFPEYITPDKKFPTAKALGLTTPPAETLTQQTIKKAGFGLRKIGSGIKVFPKVKARQAKELFTFRKTFKLSRFALKHPKAAKLFRIKKGMYGTKEVEVPYKTYGTAESMHPGLPERRLWYAKEIVTTKTKMPKVKLEYAGKDVTDFTEKQLTDLLRIDKKGLKEGIQVLTPEETPGIITQKEYIGLPTKMEQVKFIKTVKGGLTPEGKPILPKYERIITGKPKSGMKYIKTTEQEFDMFGKLILKEEGRTVLDPLSKGEGVSEFFGKIGYKKGGFTYQERVYGQIASSPAGVERLKKFPELYTPIGKDIRLYSKDVVEATKFFDVRAKTYARGIWKESYGWARTTPTTTQRYKTCKYGITI